MAAWQRFWDWKTSRLSRHAHRSTALCSRYTIPAGVSSVIAGERPAVEKAIVACKEAGARRALPLAVSGVFHTSLMAEAAKEMRAFAQDLTVHEAVMPIYTNVTGEKLEVTDLPAHLERHMCSPVRWESLVELAWQTA